MTDAEDVVCQGRLVLVGPPERATLRTPDGLFRVEYAMDAAGFQAGDLVEVRLLERCPQWGVTQFAATARRG